MGTLGGLGGDIGRLWWEHWEALVGTLGGLGGDIGGPWWGHWEALVGTLGGLGGDIGRPWWGHWEALVGTLGGLGGDIGRPWWGHWEALVGTLGGLGGDIGSHQSAVIGHLAARQGRGWKGVREGGQGGKGEGITICVLSSCVCVPFQSKHSTRWSPHV